MWVHQFILPQVYECHTLQLFAGNLKLFWMSLPTMTMITSVYFKKQTWRVDLPLEILNPLLQGMDGALEVQFELTPCDAYGPVTGPMDEDMYS